jgi:hypothetical protein
MSADPADRTLTMGSVGPQVGRNAGGLRNAVSLLVETRGGGMGRVDLKRRVNTHVTAVHNVLTSAARHADDLVKLRQFVERETTALACRGDVVLEAAPTPSEYTTSMLDPTTGDVRRLTVSWLSALQLRALKTRPRPCGYWLAESEGEAVRRLRLLGIEVQRLDELGELRGESYRLVGREPVGPDAAASNPARRRGSRCSCCRRCSTCRSAATTSRSSSRSPTSRSRCSIPSRRPALPPTASSSMSSTRRVS